MKSAGQGREQQAASVGYVRCHSECGRRKAEQSLRSLPSPSRVWRRRTGPSLLKPSLDSKISDELSSHHFCGEDLEYPPSQ